MKICFRWNSEQNENRKLFILQLSILLFNFTLKYAIRKVDIIIGAKAPIKN